MRTKTKHAAAAFTLGLTALVAGTTPAAPAAVVAATPTISTIPEAIRMVVAAATDAPPVAFTADPLPEHPFGKRILDAGAATAARIEEAQAARIAAEEAAQLEAFYAAAAAAELEAFYAGVAAAEAAKAPPAAPARPAPIAVHPDQYAAAGSIEEIIRLAAREFGINEDWFLAIAWCESTFNPHAVNKKSGAMGLFQHLPRYWGDRAARLGYSYDHWSDPVANARVSGALYVEGGPRHWECKA